MTPIAPRNFNAFLIHIPVCIWLNIQSVLSDPDKRKKYDKYGSVDEDQWDYDDFMKNFNFEDVFNIFDEDFFNVKLFL